MVAPPTSGPLPPAQAGGAPLVPAVAAALARTRAYLAQTQQQHDHWVGVLSSSALATAQALTALHVRHPQRHQALVQRGQQWLLRTQQQDGGWGDAVVDPSNVNATSLAYAALVLSGADAPAPAPALGRARARLDAFGGFAVVGDPNRCALSGPCRTLSALAGLMDWRRIKRLRPEVILLPRRFRRTISTTFPAYLSLALLHAQRAPHPLNAWPTYRVARRQALAWLAQAQGPNGSFEESAFLTSVILMALTAAGYGHLPWLVPAEQFVRASQREDGGWPIDRDLETFDTDLTVLAYAALGEPPPHAEAVRDWLLARQIQVPCFPTSAPPGGWAWAMPAGWPDCDDTSATLQALRALGVPAHHPAVVRGCAWLEQRQNADGSWSTFVRNSRMPFDHHCPYVTGHVLSALARYQRLQARPALLRRALAYLQRVQRPDGSFLSLWFREATAGTASVLEGLAACGLAASPLAQRAQRALLGLQQADGGWAGQVGAGQSSTTEETAWAIAALLRDRDTPREGARDEEQGRVDTAVERGVRWLLDHQRADGTWREAPLGLYYSAMWYSDSWYGVALPCQALALAHAAWTGRPGPGPGPC